MRSVCARFYFPEVEVSVVKINVLEFNPLADALTKIKLLNFGQQILAGLIEKPRQIRLADFVEF